uniref:Uncharacterized protein n=1 Tax=Oryza sativa subsp. japonica TaxID=39947 RepID=Q6K2J6_ORYSJ|nr:uncharacterized protein LOC112937996 isoform X3 [Oryza sativa Japonica Group]BAD21779.1 hypothetical protein [Oryza sativa Japonica Group]BAD22476.1 hypothetical protein [Oryza sativa Japonica Group]
MSQLILGVFGSALFERSACSRSHGVGGFRAPGLRRCGSTADRAGGSGSRQRRQRWRRSFPVDRGGGSGSRRRRRRRQWRLRLRGVIHHGLRQRWLVPSFGGRRRHRRATATCLVANRRGAPEDTPPAATNLDLEDSMDGGSL